VNTLQTLMPFLVAVLIFIVGVRTVITRETTLFIQLWSFGNNDGPNRSGGGYSESTQTGFVAVLIGLIEIATAIGILLKFHA